MTPADFFTVIKILFLVAAVQLFFETRWGRAVGAYFPAPFWVYFLSILLSGAGFLPSSSPVYGWAGLHILAMAIFLMLVGAPVGLIVKLGPKATAALALAAGSIFVAALVSYALFINVLPDGSWKAVGALLGTWIGGSANMIAVKEILNMSDDGLAPLVIVDTVLSYSWLALLFLGAGWQSRFDRPIKENDPVRVSFAPVLQEKKPASYHYVLAFAAGFLITEAFVLLGRKLGAEFLFLSAGAWVLLLTSTGAILLALTPVRRLGALGASQVGVFALYVVLVTIGAKSGLQAVSAAPVYMMFGVVLFLLHGLVLFSLGRAFKIPLFLLTTASQANIGGAASAPIVASVYKAGTAHIGVLMAIAGMVLGTYVGALGGIVCRAIEGWLR